MNIPSRLRAVALFALAAALIASVATPTFAADRWQHQGGWGGGHERHDWGHGGGGGGGGLLLGLGVGAAVGAAIAAPPPVYYAPAPAYYAAPPAVYYGY